MIKLWFKLFFRNSKKNWLNTLINISGLTLGLVGLIIVLLYYNQENSFDQWNPYKDNIYKVGHAFSDGQMFDDTTQPEGPKSAEVIPEITSFLAMPSWYDEDLLEVGSKATYTRKIIFTTPNFFDFFPHPLLEGNKNSLLESSDAIVISNEIKEHLFGRKKALGNTIKIGKRSFIVSGVYKLKKPSTMEPQAIMNKKKNINLDGNWRSFSYHTYYKVKSGTNIKDLEKKLFQVFVDNTYKKEAADQGLPLEDYIEQQGSIPYLEKLNGFRLHSRGDLGPLEGKGNYMFLMIMLGLSLLIIIISSINFINLSIASASQRAKEVGVKKTLGISSVSLQFQYALEIFVLCIIALVFALIITELTLPFFNDYLRISLHLNDLKLICQIVILTAVVAIIVGSLYALYISNFKSIDVLKGNFSRSKNMVFVRHLMLGLQFVISGFFLIGGLVVYNQVSFMNNSELGFSGDQIMVVNFANDSNKWKRYLLTKKVFSNDQNVQSVSTSLETPGVDQDFSNNIQYQNNIVDSKFIPIDYGHLEMIQAEMKFGRTFSKQFTSDTINSVILNETAIKRLGIENPINKIVSVFDKDVKVVGVVKDYHTDGFDKKIKPIFYMHFNSISWLKYNIQNVQFKLKDDALEQTIARIERYWNTESEPGYPFSYYFVNQQFEKVHEKYRQQKMLFTILTIEVIFIALLGLFALSSLTIQQRLKEVAIRKTLGASTKEIIFQLIKSFIKIACIASLVLIPLSFYLMQNWLDNFVYRIEMPLLPYIIAPILLTLLVIIVVGLKALSATKIDLIKYLKFE